MRKIFIFLLLPFLLVACEDDGKYKFIEGESKYDRANRLLPDGFEWISSDRQAHFLYVAERHRGEKIAQREAGKKLCTKIFPSSGYCEIYMWSTKEDVPKKFPIINRKTMVGLYELKNGKMSLKALPNQ